LKTLAAAALGVMAFTILLLDSRAGAETTGSSPAPTPTGGPWTLSAQQWSRESEEEKESSLSAMIALYKIGWVHGYLSRAQRDAQALLPKDEPVYARPIAVYVEELTAYFKTSSTHIGLPSAVGCLASNLTPAEIAPCGSDFPLNK
jgi:hypothetical protein